MIWMVVLAVACSVAGALYHGLRWSGYGHSAAMFLGLPAILATLLAMMPKAKTITGGIVKGITLALLIVAPLVGEGYLCILMASPLFYFVGVLVGTSVDSVRRRGNLGRNTTLSCVAVVLLPMCLEGVVPQLTPSRAETVFSTQVFAATPAQVQAALAQSPRTSARLPGFLRIGFPRPLAARGCGLALDDTRTIHFAGAEGDPPGDLVMRVAAEHPGYAAFATVSDTSKLTQWLRWQSSEVQWAAVDAQHTRVTWTIHFQRGLDPAWYFGPWERYAVRKAASYLIQANVQANLQPADGAAQ